MGVIFLQAVTPMKKTLFFLAMCLFLTANGQETKGIYHLVKKGERVRKIAEKYGVKSKDIYRLNPGLKRRPKPNTRILIPVDVSEGLSKILPINQVHKVQSKETLYGICKQYNISIASLKKTNPFLQEGHLEVGMVLKIPAEKLLSKEALQDENFAELHKRFVLHRVVKGDTFFKLTRRYQTTKSELLFLNPSLKEGLKLGLILKVKQREKEFDFIENLEALLPIQPPKLTAGTSLNVAFLLPFKFSKNDTLPKEVLFASKNNLVSVIADFYLGAEMAIDSLQKQGLKIEHFAFDSEKNKDSIQHLIDRDKFEGVDVVFGPVYSHFADWTASKLKEIPVVFPFYSSRQKSFRHPNLIKTAPDAERYQKRVIEHIKTSLNGEHLVLVGDEKPSTLSNMLSVGAQLKQGDTLQKCSYLQPNEGYIDRERFVAAVDTLGVNWVLLTSKDKVLTADVVNNLKSLPNHPEVKLFAFEKGSNFDLIDNNQLAKMNFTYASSDALLDPLQDTLQDTPHTSFQTIFSREAVFFENYARKNFTYPSKYALRGFDVVYDVLMRMATQEASSNEVFRSSGGSKQLRTVFDYHRESSDEPVSNRAVFLWKYEEDLSVRMLSKSQDFAE